MNEIQRKFLVSADIMRWLETYEYHSEEVEQFYVKSDENVTLYYKKYLPNIYTKVLVDKEKKEHFTPIQEEEYLSQRSKHIGRKIVKKSYTVYIEDERYVVYEYMKKLEGLYMLFAYCSSEKYLKDSHTLETLQPFILKEIDVDKKYEDETLALCVKPMEYNITKFFEKIDAFEAANLFFWQVPSRLYVRDGVSLVLYKNLRLLHYYKVNYQRKHFSATLHRLRVLLRRTATLLETFSDYFNPNVTRFSRDLLLRYHEEAKVLRYLYFLEELCSTKEDAKMTLYSELKTLISNEEKAVVQMLLSQPFGQLIQILTRELYDAEYHQYKPLKKEVKKAVRKKLDHFQALLSKTQEGYDDDLLDDLYTSMDSLQTLIEDFYHIIGEDKTKLIVEEINILLKPLREYRNCKERAMILEAIKDQADNQNLDTEPLLCTHEKVLRQKIETACKLLRSSTFYL